MKDVCRSSRGQWSAVVGCVVGCMGAIAWINPVMAQLVPDATLGGERSVVSPLSQAADRIDGGALRGINLFHSFEQFNVGAGRGVYFANPTGVENILSRVTGSSRSEILGRLGVLGNANLFLLNPNGIVFGANASLDIAGSFTASTANAIALGTQGFFSASQPENSSLLAIAPGALFFDQQVRQPKTIQNSGNLTAGRDLTLAADNLELQGQVRSGGNLTLQAQDTLRIRDSVTAPFIAAAGGKLLVQGDRSVDIFALNHPDSGLFSGGDMVLRSGNTIGGDAHYTAGGAFRIEQLNGTPGNLFSPYDPIIYAFGDVVLDSYTGASLHILAGGNVTIRGDVTIDSADASNNAIIDRSFQLSDGSLVQSFNGSGIDGTSEPTLDIRAGMDWAKLGGFPLAFFPAQIFDVVGGPLTLFPPTVSLAPSGSSIRVEGTISVGTPNQPGLTLLTNQYAPNTLNGSITVNGSILAYGSVYIDSRGSLTTGPATLPYGGVDTSAPSGTAGEIKLIADGAVDTTRGNINSFIGNVNNGNIVYDRGTAGDITITSRNGSITTAGISSLVRGGTGGNITLTAAGNIVPGNITSSIYDFGVAGDKAGDITFKSNSDVILVGSKIASTTSAAGNAGNISVQARSLSLSPSLAILTDPNNAVSIISSDTSGAGNAGAISLQTQSLNVAGGSEIVTRTSASGNAAYITVQPLDSSQPSEVNISGYAPFTGSITNGIPNGGFSSGLFVSTENPPQQNSAPATGSAGIILIDGITTLNVRDGGVLSARTRSQGNAGQDRFGNGQPISIFANVQDLNLTGGGQILSPTYSTGAAGNILINATGTVTIQGSDNNYTARVQALAAVLQPQDPLSEAALAEALITIDPVSQNSGIIASDLPLLSLDPEGLGAPGTIVIQAGAVRMSDIGVIESRNNGTQPGGGVGIRTQNLSLSGGAEILSETFGSGRAGSIAVEPIDATAPSVVSISGVAPYPLLGDGILPGGFSSGLFATTEKGATGQGGTISVTTGALRIEQGGAISTRSRGAGNVVANSGDSAININVDNLVISSGGQILTTGFSTGRAGGISVNAASDILITGTDPNWQLRFDAVKNSFDENTARFAIDTTSPVSGLQAQSSTGSGDINVISATGSLFIRDNAEIDSSISGEESRAGSVVLQAPNGSVSFENARVFSTVESGAVNSFAGGIGITGKSISLTNAAQLQTLIRQGASGSVGIILMLASDSITASGNGTRISSSIEAGATGSIDGSVNLLGLDRGAVLLGANNILFSDGAVIDVATKGRGNAGIAVLAANDTVSFTGDSTSVFSTVESEAVGNAGGIGIQARSVFLSGGANLQALTRGDGKAGFILIEASDSVELSGTSPSLGFSTGILTSTEDTAVQGENIPEGGDIQIKTGTLRVLDGAVLSARTRNEFKGGSISVETNTLKVSGGGQILTTASGAASGVAGDVSIDASGDIDLSGRDANFTARQSLASAAESQFLLKRGAIFDNVENGFSGLFANTEDGTTAQGGNISVSARNLSVLNNAQISVNARSTTKKAGDIKVTVTDIILLDGRGEIQATTRSGDGGSIALSANKYLLLRRDSLISTQAGLANAPGTGGNITINTPFLIAVPSKNSDITANAFFGSGGKIVVNGIGAFGIRVRPLNPKTNDIDASSAFGPTGTIDFNTSDGSFLENSLTEFPQNLIDPNTLLANSCIVRNREKNRGQNGTFLVTGSGGLPVRPNDAPLSSYPTGEVRSLPQTQTNGTWQPGDPIVEPQGIYRLTSGRLVMSRECEP